MILHSVDLVAELMRKATTRTGLSVVVDILDKVYETGQTSEPSHQRRRESGPRHRPAPMELSYLTQYVISGSYFVSVPRVGMRGRKSPGVVATVSETLTFSRFSARPA